MFEGRRKPPLPIAFTQETVVLQVAVADARKLADGQRAVWIRTLDTHA